MKPSQDEILALVRDSLMGIVQPDCGDQELTVDTPLVGSRAVIDSIGLVNLIADIEEAVAERYGVDIVLADARAMSRTHSPFRRLSSLADAVHERILEKV